jgi:hypothetical protein
MDSLNALVFSKQLTTAMVELTPCLPPLIGSVTKPVTPPTTDLACNWINKQLNEHCQTNGDD